jgi:hypothetical protein
MTGPPALRPLTITAPTDNRAQQEVMVRMYNGELAGHISIVVAEMLLASGAAQCVGQTRLRYIRLEPGIMISKSHHGWGLIEEERRRHGDNAVRRGIKSFDRRSLIWQPPKRNPRPTNPPEESR